MLSQQYHSRILADIDNICRRANVPKKMLDQSAKEYCSGTELQWLTRFPFYQRKNQGLVLLGKHTPGPDIKMMAMASALLRNYVDARLLTVQGLLQDYENGGVAPDPTVLFVPNLFVRQGGKGLPSWKMQLVYDLLLSRFTSGRISVLYVEDLGAMAAEYGQLFAQHLEANYQMALQVQL